jgi:hypothetical protein
MDLEPETVQRLGRSPSSPFRRLTKARAELATYIEASAVNRPSTAPSLARMEHETRP